MAVDLPPEPGLASFRALLPSTSPDKAIDHLVSLFRRRQIRGPKPSALATAWLLRKVIAATRASEPTKILLRVQEVGKLLIDAAPRELTVGNIIRRVLGAIREESENRNDDSASDISSIPPTPSGDVSSPTAISVHPSRERPMLYSQQTGRPPVTSMFSIISHPTMRGQAGTSSPIRSGSSTPQVQTTDFRAEILEAITEIVDELDTADEQVAGYALEFVAGGETVFTYGTSPVVQKFLLRAASKRKFTVVAAEGYPNAHTQTHSFLTGKKTETDTFTKTLTAHGVTVVLVPDSNIFAMMSRATKVVVPANAVLSNGSIVAAAGTKMLVSAAKYYRVPVMVLAETYKLSPLVPYDQFDFVDYGDVQDVVPYQDREMQLGCHSIKNPVTELVDAGNIDLFVTNLGGVSTGYMYATIRDQYHDQDLEL